MTRPLRHPAVWARVRQILLSSQAPILVALDLDGTLAPIVSRPERARVSARTLRVLERAVRAPGVGLVVLSARPRSDLRTLIPVRGVELVGQYGLEGPLAPGARERGVIRRTVRRLGGTLRRVAAAHPGAWVENKGLSVAVHDRAVGAARLPALHRELRAVARQWRKEGLDVSLGRRITDFVPRGYDKGRALRRLTARDRPRATFYFGDSPADEPAFSVLKRVDFPIRVGGGRTGAPYRVRDVGGVTRFLGDLVSLRSRRT